MKIRHCREKVVVFMFSIILIMGMTACSFHTSGETDQGSTVGLAINAEVPRETVSQNLEMPATQTTEIPQPEAEITKTPETATSEDKGNEYSDAGEISVGDPIVGVVDKFADNLIIIKDTDDPDLVYYFSTQNAQVVEGDSPIAVGDRVAISYRGVMGDEEHPGEAVKVVAESIMYQ